MKKGLTIIASVGALTLASAFALGCDGGATEVAPPVPEKLAAPVITLTDNIVEWRAVENADSYAVTVGTDSAVSVTATSYTLDIDVAGSYPVYVIAKSDNTVEYADSDKSNIVTYIVEDVIRIPDGVKDVPSVNAVDSFIGAVSNAAYDGEEKAVKAFFGDELIGEFLSYEKKGELPAEYVAKLGISDAENIKAVSSVDVKFKEADIRSMWESMAVSSRMTQYSNVRATAETDSVRMQQAYIAEYNDGTYKYYSPRPSDGELVTKSYFYSLIDGSKYLNCTARAWDHYQDTDDFSDNLRRDEDEIVTVVSGDVLKSTFTSKSFYEVDGAFVPDEDDDDESDVSYFVKRDGRTYGQLNGVNADGIYKYWECCKDWKYLDGERGRHDAYEYADYADWNDEVFKQIFSNGDVADMVMSGYAFFEKTATGFKATENAFMMLGYDGDPSEKMFEFSVDDGKIIKVEMGLVWNFDGKEIFSKVGIEVDSFGTTETLKLPAELSASLDDYIDEYNADIKGFLIADEAAWKSAFDYTDNNNYAVSVTEDKKILGTWENDWNERPLSQFGYTEYIEDGEILILEQVNCRDWINVNDVIATHVYADGDKRYSRTIDLNKVQYDPATGQAKWSDATELTKPVNVAPFAPYAELVDLYSEFKYDVSLNAYVCMTEFQGAQCYYAVKIQNGKVVSVGREYKAEVTTPENEQATAMCRESTAIIDVGSVDISEMLKNIEKI